MIEVSKLTAYLKLIEETEQQTLNASHDKNLTGVFAQAVLCAKITGLLPGEVRAAVLIGYQRGCQHENWLPSYGFLLAQLSYWEAIYDEAEQFWFQRCRTDDGA